MFEIEMLRSNLRHLTDSRSQGEREGVLSTEELGAIGGEVPAELGSQAAP